MGNLLFYGIITFEEKDVMKGEPFLGIARDEIGWVCGPLTRNLDDLKLGYSKIFPLQMNEFLREISTLPFELEYIDHNQALARLDEIKTKEKLKQDD